MYNNISKLTVLLLFLELRADSPRKDSDVGLDTIEMIENHGYVGQTHDIQTEDGYILTYHRIPHGKNSTNVSDLPPVLLMHGVGASSADFVNMGPNLSLGYILADKGYDVWLGNARGNAWARKHVTLDVNRDAEKFFNFSFHEIGYYDLAAAVDYILEINGNSGLYYIAHSMGTTSFFVLASTRPEYNDKIRLASLMAPIAGGNRSTPLQATLRYNIYNFERLAKLFGIFEVPGVDLLRNIGVNFCTLPRLRHLCEGILFQMFGFDKPQFNSNKIGVLFSTTPTNVPLKPIYHLGQVSRNGEFRQYDYGSEKNLEIYGTNEPPMYDLSKITTPVAFYYGKNDLIVNMKDVRELIKKIKNVANDYLVPYDLFNHLDFIYGVNAKELLYPEIIRVMEKY